MMKLKEKVKIFSDTFAKYANRNTIILGDADRFCEKNRVNLHYWVSGAKENLGDYLSKGLFHI